MALKLLYYLYRKLINIFNNNLIDKFEDDENDYYFETFQSICHQPVIIKMKRKYTDTILFDGKLYTTDKEFNTLATKNGNIVALGKRKEIFEKYKANKYYNLRWKYIFPLSPNLFSLYFKNTSIAQNEKINIIKMLNIIDIKQSLLNEKIWIKEDGKADFLIIDQDIMNIEEHNLQEANILNIFISGKDFCI